MKPFKVSTNLPDHLGQPVGAPGLVAVYIGDEILPSNEKTRWLFRV